MVGSEDTILRVDRLNKRYGSTVAVHELTFGIRPGDVVALLGPNGSGKTTIVKSIVGLIGYSGNVFFDGQPTKNETKYLRDIGVVLEGSRNIHWRLTVEQNAEYFYSLRAARRRTTKKTISDLMEKLGIARYRDTVVAKLSTGTRQKVALLCALAHGPRLVLMDEPTLGLDLETAKDLQSIVLAKAKEDEVSFLVTSHDLQFIEKISDFALVLSKGALTFSGPIENLKSRLHKYEMRLDFEGNIPEWLEKAESLRLLDGTSIRNSGPDSLFLRFSSPQTALEIAKMLKDSQAEVVNFESYKLGIEQAYTDLMDAP